LAALGFVIFTSPHGRISAQADASKLTTLLADLVRASEAAGTARPLAADRMPKSAQDAIQGRKLRLDASGAVQVYALMEEISDDNLAALAATGAAIEITDAAHRWVQAHVAVGRLRGVAALPFVNFVRLPNYAVAHIGAVTSEGDAILHSDAVRQQFSLDG